LAKRAVPVDRRAVWALRGSSLGLDLYTWATWRVAYLEKPVTVPWPALRVQLGCSYQRDRDLRRRVIGAMGPVSEVYPALRWAASEAGLTIAPSPPHVPRRDARRLFNTGG